MYLCENQSTMKGIVLSFLRELAQNNNRDWFQANKGWYEEARLEVENFVNTLIPGITRFDPSVRFTTAKESMFRIFRDVRFSKDKAPYKVNMGAWITHSGRKCCGPGYYIHLQPGESFLASGIYMPDPNSLKKIRQEIYYNIAEFKNILGNKDLGQFVEGLDNMDRLVRPPKGFPLDFPDMEILKKRHYTISNYLKDEQIERPEFVDFTLRVFKAMHPFNTFLARALEG